MNKESRRNLEPAAITTVGHDPTRHLGQVRGITLKCLQCTAKIRKRRREPIPQIKRPVGKHRIQRPTTQFICMGASGVQVTDRERPFTADNLKGWI